MIFDLIVFKEKLVCVPRHNHSHVFQERDVDSDPIRTNRQRVMDLVERERRKERSQHLKSIRENEDLREEVSSLKMAMAKGAEREKDINEKLAVLTATAHSAINEKIAMEVAKRECEQQLIQVNANLEQATLRIADLTEQVIESGALEYEMQMKYERERRRVASAEAEKKSAQEEIGQVMSHLKILQQQLRDCQNRNAVLDALLQNTKVGYQYTENDEWRTKRSEFTAAVRLILPDVRIQDYSFLIIDFD